MLNAAQRIVGSYGSHKEEKVERDLEVARGRLADCEARLGRPFAHEQYMSELADLRDRLKLALSDHPPEGELSSAESAGKIKDLRSTVTVEESPKREARAATAEVPVTRRIRRKPRHPAEGSKEEPPATPQVMEPVRSHALPAFREAVAQRREKASQRTLF